MYTEYVTYLNKLQINDTFKSLVLQMHHIYLPLGLQ